MPIIHWFRRDYRVCDNTALAAAARDSADGVIGVFVFDDAVLRHPGTGAPVVSFMLDSLRELRDNLRKLGSDLVCLHGRPAEQLLRLATAVGASAVYYNRDYAPPALARDAEVEPTLHSRGIGVRVFADQVIFEQQQIVSASGRPYTVYTPYRKAWLSRLAETYPDGVAVLPRPTRARMQARIRLKQSDVPQPNIVELPTAESLGFTLTQQIAISAGEASARRMLDRFCERDLKTYATTRNQPALDHGTSRLSPHLRHGTISPRQCLVAVQETRRELGRSVNAGAAAWVGELVWREFFQQLLFNHPRVEHEPSRPQWRDVQFPQNDEHIEAWRYGRTGFPIVDAGMRCLNATGWLHNRLRMVVAMFLTKDLLLDYRLGERWFMQHLIDGETAQNNGNWQWCAGCGADAAPYFRILNPQLQSRRYDPDGTFVRRWVPELAGTSTGQIHDPPELERVLRNYPPPIVDHAAARARALKFLAAP